MYVSIAPLGQVRRRADDGSWTLVHQFGPGSGGLPSSASPRTGRNDLRRRSVHRPVSTRRVGAAPDGGARRLRGSKAILFPNGIALDEHGALYVTDSVLGAIWRIEPGHCAGSGPRTRR